MSDAATTLTLQHFMTPAAHAHRNLLVPWADKIARESDGELKVELFTGMALGGRADELFDQTRDGRLDLSWMLPSYNPGRFLKSEVFELPFVAASSARVTSRAFQEFVEAHAMDEFAEVKPLFFWAHDFGVLCLNRPVRDLDDLKGRRVRFLTRAQKELLGSLGMVPCKMGIYPAVEAFGKGDIDGLILPWEGARSFGVMKYATYFVEFDFTPTLYTQTHMMTMNRASYENLPANLKTVIDANSGMATADWAGAAWDSEAAIVRQEARASGDVLTLDQHQIAEIQEVVKPASRYWMNEMSARSLDPQFYIEHALSLVKKHNHAHLLG